MAGYSFFKMNLIGYFSGKNQRQKLDFRKIDQNSSKLSSFSRARPKNRQSSLDRGSRGLAPVANTRRRRKFSRYSLRYASRILKNNQVEKTRKTTGYPGFLKLENLIGYYQKTLAITLTASYSTLAYATLVSSALPTRPT